MQWVPCPGCGLQYQPEQLLMCARCYRGFCVSCLRGVKVFDAFSGRVDREGWLCGRCRDDLGPDGYHVLFPDLYS